MFVGDVPVYAAENLHIALVCREISPGAGVVSILFLDKVGYGLEVLESSTGKVCICISNTILRASPAVCYGRSLGVLCIDEVEELVLHDRSAKGEAVSGVAVPVAGT